MRKIRSLVLLLPILISFQSCFQEKWVEYKDDELNFKIKFYQNPEFNAEELLFFEDTITNYSFAVNVSDSLHENKYYSLIVTPYPSSYIHSDSILVTVEEFINSTQNDLIRLEGYTLLSSTLTEKNGFPGKIFKWKIDNSNIFFEFHVFLVESTLFQLSVVSNEGKNHNIFIEKYIDSFEIINISNGNFKTPKNSAERTYSIKFPRKPTEESIVSDSEYGRLTLDIQIFEPKVKNDNMVYIALETKYPEIIINENDLNELNAFFKKSIESSVESVSGELISIKDINYNSYLGKEYRIYHSEKKALLVYRIFFIDNHLYTYGIITQPDNDNNKEMIKFLDSFSINKYVAQ